MTARCIHVICLYLIEADMFDSYFKELTRSIKAVIQATQPSRVERWGYSKGVQQRKGRQLRYGIIRDQIQVLNHTNKKIKQSLNQKPLYQP